MELQVYTKNGELAGRTIDVSDKIFAAKVNEHAVYLAVLAQRANSRQGTHATKTRSMVAGGGKKPWRQKGRGTARAGTIRSPLWRGGGTVHGPQPHPHTFRLPKKVKRLARISVLSSKVKEEKLKVLEDFTLEAPKTKEMYSVLKGFGLEGSRTLLLVSDHDEAILRASRNIKNFKVAMAADASAYDLLNCQTLLVTESSVKKLEGTLEK